MIKPAQKAILWCELETAVEMMLVDLGDVRAMDDDEIRYAAKRIVQVAHRLADIDAIEERQQNALEREIRRQAIARRTMYRARAR